MRERITSEIERRRAEMAGLDTRRLVLASQIAVLEELLADAPSPDSGRTAPRGESGGGRSVAKGRLSDRWMPVLTEAVRRYPGTIRGDEAPEIQIAAGQEPADAGNIRSHFWTNSQPGKLYERVGQSEYRATAAGAALVGVPLGGANTNGATEVAPSMDFENIAQPTPTTDEG